MTNITPSTLGNKYQLRISPISILEPNSSPVEKKEGEKAGKIRASITDIPSHGSQDDEMIKQTRSGHCIVTCYPTLPFRFG